MSHVYEAAVKITTDRALSLEQEAHVRALVEGAIQEALRMGTLNLETDEVNAIPDVRLLSVEVPDEMTGVYVSTPTLRM